LNRGDPQQLQLTQNIKSVSETNTVNAEKCGNGLIGSMDFVVEDVNLGTDATVRIERAT